MMLQKLADILHVSQMDLQQTTTDKYEDDGEVRWYYEIENILEIILKMSKRNGCSCVVWSCISLQTVYVKRSMCMEAYMQYCLLF